MRPVFSLLLASCDGSAIEQELLEGVKPRDPVAEHAERHAARKYQAADIEGLFRDPDEGREAA